jgi:hypothetical protein
VKEAVALVDGRRDSMKNGAILVVAFAASALALSGCALLGGDCGGDQYSSNQFDNSQDQTLFRGKQPDETKRHSDDWAEPLLDNAFGDP